MSCLEDWKPLLMANSKMRPRALVLVVAKTGWAVVTLQGTPPPGDTARSTSTLMCILLIPAADGVDTTATHTTTILGGGNISVTAAGIRDRYQPTMLETGIMDFGLMNNDS